MKTEWVLALLLAIPLFISLILLIFARRYRGVREYSASNQRIKDSIEREQNFFRRTNLPPTLGGGL